MLAVKGVCTIAGGPYDLAESLGHPGKPDHSERRRLSNEIDERVRSAGKWTFSDRLAILWANEMILTGCRQFVVEHAGDTAWVRRPR
ncbi:MAG: hypothetical protein EPO26_00175 [Chloroflexota bacterium]|nr:MAG: hypothetical protein EPO26_00175 [Chloroflexota bacterium]